MDYGNMRMAALKKLAKERGLVIPFGSKKDLLIEAMVWQDENPDVPGIEDGEESYLPRLEVSGDTSTASEQIILSEVGDPVVSKTQVASMYGYSVDTFDVVQNISELGEFLPVKYDDYTFVKEHKYTKAVIETDNLSGGHIGSGVGNDSDVTEAAVKTQKANDAYKSLKKALNKGEDLTPHWDVYKTVATSRSVEDDSDSEVVEDSGGPLFFGQVSENTSTVSKRVNVNEPDVEVDYVVPEVIIETDSLAGGHIGSVFDKMVPGKGYTLAELSYLCGVVVRDVDFDGLEAEGRAYRKNGGTRWVLRPRS